MSIYFNDKHEMTLFFIIYLCSDIYEVAAMFFGYVQGMNSFPKPLSRDDEKIYLDKFAEGDEGARNILIEHNLRLVAHVVKKYVQTTGKESDDLISIGTIGLIKGIMSFNADKGARLATYAIRCIENEILMYLRSSKKTDLDISLQEPVGTDKEGNEISMMDLLGADGSNVSEEVELKLEIRVLYNKLKKVLKERELDIIKMRYGLEGNEEMTQKEVGSILGISRSYVSRIEKKALGKLKKSL